MVTARSRSAGTFRCPRATGLAESAGTAAAETATWHDRAKGSVQAPGLGDQSELAGPGDGLGAVGRAELAEDVADVLLNRIEGDHQLRGDARVRRAGGQQHEDFQLAGGQLLDQAKDRLGGAPP